MTTLTGDQATRQAKRALWRESQTWTHQPATDARKRADAAYRQVMQCSQNVAVALAAYNAEMAR